MQLLQLAHAGAQPHVAHVVGPIGRPAEDQFIEADFQNHGQRGQRFALGYDFAALVLRYLRRVGVDALGELLLRQSALLTRGAKPRPELRRE